MLEQTLLIVALVCVSGLAIKLVTRGHASGGCGSSACECEHEHDTAHAAPVQITSRRAEKGKTTR
jgi:hypothetical protein